MLQKSMTLKMLIDSVWPSDQCLFGDPLGDTTVLTYVHSFIIQDVMKLNDLKNSRRFYIVFQTRFAQRLSFKILKMKAGVFQFSRGGIFIKKWMIPVKDIIGWWIQAYSKEHKTCFLSVYNLLWYYDKYKIWKQLNFKFKKICVKIPLLKGLLFILKLN